VEIVEKEDLDLKNHLAGLQQKYLKVTFATVSVGIDLDRRVMSTLLSPPPPLPPTPLPLPPPPPDCLPVVYMQRGGGGEGGSGGGGGYGGGGGDESAGGGVI